MEQFINFLKGNVQIRLTSKMPERFLKMCAHHGIFLRNIRHRDGFYEMELSLKDFFRLQPICRKNHCRIHVLRKTGMPFFFYKNKKRKAFFVGIFLGLALLYLCSTRIWNIHVEGNYSYSVESILEYLETENTVHGMAKRKLNCSQIAASLRGHFEEITWVSVRIQGTRLLIHIQENMDSFPADEVPEQSAPCNLVAETGGEIVHMVTRQGVPQVYPGQICKKGDLLVSGCLEILNDSKEVIRYEYVEADADIYIQRKYPYEDTIPMNYHKRIYSGEERKKFCLQLGDYRLTLGFPAKSYEQYDNVESIHPVKLTENFQLPLSWGICRERQYERRKLRRSDEEARRMAQERLMNLMNKLSEKGMKISGNNVKISINEDVCVSNGTLTLIEKIGEKAPVEKLPNPEERIQSNEQ